MKMLSAVVAALYGGGDNRTLIRLARPAQIISCLRREGEGELTWKGVIDSLRKENFTQEALYLSNEAKFEAAYKLIVDGKIITLGCDMYPKLLISAMGVNAPPIIWISDPDMRKCQPWNNNDGTQRVNIGAVGCRTPLSIGHSIAVEVGRWTADNGYFAVSGGAIGCDTAFGNSTLSSGGEVVHILPHGLDHMAADLLGYAMSVCPPKEPFSPGRAMERNNLIYAFGHTTVVCSVRYRQGGSWQGAATALKANRPVVVADWTSSGLVPTLEDQASGTYAQAQRTLSNLGAHPLLLDIQTFRSDIHPALDEALDWSLGRIAGNINSGLFSS